MSENKLVNLIEPREHGKWCSDIRVLVSENIEHPIMVWLRDMVKSLAIVDSDKLDMPKFYQHIKFMKEEFERENGSKYIDVLTSYSYSECCGYTIIIKKGSEEIRIRYKQVWTGLVTAEGDIAPPEIGEGIC